MAKSLHHRDNKIFLDKLRELREARNLRQSDLARLLGRTQNRVSNVERGETRLDVIELRDWLDALGYDFICFLNELEADLRRLDALRPRAHGRKGLERAGNSRAGQIIKFGASSEK